MALHASQQLKVVGVLVIGLSGLLLFLAAVGLAVDQKKIIDALLVCLALWVSLPGSDCCDCGLGRGSQVWSFTVFYAFPELCQSLT
jgi:hypothetical protein